MASPSDAESSLGPVLQNCWSNRFDEIHASGIFDSGALAEAPNRKMT
jgi:hypothetical protein